VAVASSIRLIANYFTPFLFFTFMKKPYMQSVGLTQRLRQLGLTTLLAGGATMAAHAQSLNYTPALATNIAGTYTDLAATGTAITTANTDDANSAVQNIGFTFNYNGNAYTQFVLNTNGYLKLGATAPASPYFYASEQVTTGGPLNSTTEPNLVLPFNTDLTAGSAGTEYRVSTTGTAGSRVCTIQWKNVSDKAGTIATQYANLSFQVKLYEANNQIDFVYGTATTGAASTATYRTVAVGLKGSSAATAQLLTVQKASSQTWDMSVAQVGDYPAPATGFAPTGHNVRATILPDAGRTYRFVPAAANDAAVSAVYTLGKVVTPAGLPHTVSARITNAGTTALTNLQVTLNITGANTFTNTQAVASLAVGASTTVTFAAYPNTLTAGTNTVTVSVPADGSNANNSVAQSQLVNTTTFSYIDPTQTTPTGGGLGANNTAGGILASKFTLSAARTVTAVTVYLPNTTGLAGNTIYGAVLSSTGTILGRSADYVITAADVNTVKTLTLTTPAAVPVGDFYAGTAQPASAAPFFPVGVQSETPTRTGAFYGFALAGGTPTDIAAQNFGRFMIEAIVSTTTATSPELMRAVTVYPNPSTSGVFNLAINGANAQKGLEVEVVNTLGQRVYAGTARDNFTTTLDLSNLANGLYHLKIKNGDEYMQRQLSVVK
jgi:hypothetical protein